MTRLRTTPRARLRGGLSLELSALLGAACLGAAGLLALGSGMDGAIAGHASGEEDGRRDAGRDHRGDDRAAGAALPASHLPVSHVPASQAGVAGTLADLARAAEEGAELSRAAGAADQLGHVRSASGYARAGRPLAAAPGPLAAPRPRGVAHAGESRVRHLDASPGGSAARVLPADERRLAGEGGGILLPFTIGLDLDGVVAKPTLGWLRENFSGLLRSFFQSGFSLRLKDKFWRMHDIAANEHGLYRRMGVVKGAPEALGSLADEGARVHVVTARPTADPHGSGLARDTRAWLDDAGIPHHRETFTREKTGAPAHIYVDDSPKNIRAYQEAGLPVVIMHRWYNRKLEGLRARTWADALEIIRQYKADFEAAELGPAALAR